MLVFGVSSKGNHVEPFDGMDDNHSYAIALTLDGRPAWIHQAGGVFTNCFPRVGNYDADSAQEVLCAYREQSQSGENAAAAFGSVFKIIELDGTVSNTFTFGPDTTMRNITRADVLGDSTAELIITFADNVMVICDQQFNPIVRIRANSEVDFLAAGDFVGNQKRQFLLTVSDGNTFLLDESFETLAWLETTADRFLTHIIPEESSPTIRLILGGVGGEHTYFVAFRKNPWTSIFFRKPWLASLVVFFPMTLVVLLIAYSAFRIRRKNGVIEQQRVELSETLQQLRNTQAQLVQVEKFRTARDIAGTFAHEIRNALVPVEIAHHRLQSRLAEDEKSIASLKNADRAVSRALELTTMISTYVKSGTEGPTEAVDMRRVVAAVLSDLSARIEERKVELTFPDSPTSRAAINTAIARSLVTNLITNALDAVEQQPSPHIMIAIEPSGEMIRLTVRDNGPGIDATIMPRMFEPFVSTKPRDGHGLGLALVRRTVEQYGGTVTAANRPEGGAEFVVLLPVFKASGMNPTFVENTSPYKRWAADDCRELGSFCIFWSASYRSGSDSVLATHPL